MSKKSGCAQEAPDRATMAAIKRKSTTPTTREVHKKFRKENEAVPRVKQEESSTDSSSRSNNVWGGASDEGPLDDSKIAETAWDSDPLVESDTASSSGAGDGASWPSDDEEDSEGQFEGLPDRDNDPNGGVALVAEEREVTNESKPKVQNGASSSSRESHAKQRETAKERKAAKPNADSIARTKKLWEKLRRKSHVPQEERKALVAELFDIITGHIHDFVFKHDSVRVVQTAVKYGRPEQKRMIARELKGDFKSLTESKYAKFLVGKLLSYGDEQIRDMVIPEFYGHVRQMIKHPEAAWILDDVYRAAATPDQKAALLREWYGPEFSLFRKTGDKSITADLKAILEGSPEKRKPIMRYLHELINLLLQKKTAGFTILHDAMLQYYVNLQQGSEDSNEFIELLKGDEEGDLLKNLAFTKPGADLVCLALAYTNAKDRKLILRSYRKTIQMMAYDNYAHKVLLTAFDVIDDTVLTSKVILPELLGADEKIELHADTVFDAMKHGNARIPLLYVFAGRSRNLIPPTSHTSTLDVVDKIQDIRKTTSRKDPEARRSELVKFFSPPLLRLIADQAPEAVTSTYGCQFISEILLANPQCNPTDRERALGALVNLTNSAETRELLKQPSARRMLRNLVQGGHYNPQSCTVDYLDPPLGFDEQLYQAIRNEITEWAVSENSFVVVAMLESASFKHRKELKELLSADKERIEDAARAQVVSKTNGKVQSTKKKKPGEKGNGGAKILLQLLNE
ncbi:uncharacterized protein KY384_002051 [Bacidia gigantensis]|uniref:uncharacterized protein n=1 Tax=Bacidia gigantensis TaxID=2732470 RepID=UPI001D038D5E|nr:uncharacterized protein KY384_002051 [Bacidia gigantensis]KAG8533268.1 hypothetical protein KY384_002051 [Bacidia gigantensis]